MVEVLCVLLKSKWQKPIQSLVECQKKSQPVGQLLGRHVLPEVWGGLSGRSGPCSGAALIGEKVWLSWRACRLRRRGSRKQQGGERLCGWPSKLCPPWAVLWTSPMLRKKERRKSFSFKISFFLLSHKALILRFKNSEWESDVLAHTCTPRIQEELQFLAEAGELQV